MSIHINMLPRPIYKERYPEYTIQRKHCFYKLTNCHCPEAIAILEQYNHENIEPDYPDYYRLNLILNPYAKYPYDIKRPIQKPDSESEPEELHPYQKIRYDWIMEYPNNVDWNSLSKDPNAIHILETYPEKIKKMKLLRNPNPRAIKLIQKLYTYEEIFANEDCIAALIDNPNGRDILMHYGKPFTGELLEDAIKTPALLHLIYMWDYEKMKQNNRQFAEELCAKVFHPIRVNKIAATHNMDVLEWLELM